MSRNHYKNFLRLLEKWPVDETKKGRDLGEFIRAQVAKNFSQGEATTVHNSAECEKVYDSLHRIARDFHSKKYPRTLSSTATGLSPEISGKACSNEMLEEFNK